MARARRDSPTSQATDAKEPVPSGSADPLGRLVEVYQTNLAIALVLGLVIGLIGAGILGYALAQRPHPLTPLMIGAFTLLFALWWSITHLVNAGRRLEVRKRGLRFVERGRATELAWTEIRAIDVDRADNTNLGVGSIHRRSSNITRASSPLTKTDWDVTIRASGGRSIRLRASFMRIVRDPRKLIAHLRLRAGLE